MARLNATLRRTLFHAKQGLTLVELVVASLVSTMVIFGLFSVMQSVQNTSSTLGLRTYIDTSTQAVVNHLINNAEKMRGNGGSGVGAASGYLLSPDTPAGFDTLCLGQNNGTGADINTWACYTWDKVTKPGQIFYCQQPNPLPCPATSTMIGTATDIQSSFANGYTFTTQVTNALNGVSKTSTGSTSPQGHTNN